MRNKAVSRELDLVSLLPLSGNHGPEVSLIMVKLIHEFLVVWVHLRDHIFNVFHFHHLLGYVSQRHVLLQGEAAHVSPTVRH